MRYKAGDLIQVYQGSSPPMLATVQAIKGFHYVLHYSGNFGGGLMRGSFTSNGYYVDVESNSIPWKAHSKVKRNKFKDSPYS